MKKLIGIIAIIIGLSSCGHNSVNVNQVLIIREIEKSDSPYCKYYGDNRTLQTFSSTWCIVDTCGKWNVGDTIKLR